MSHSKVSVVIAALNTERYIREAIDSILQQTYPHWEIVIADDGSSDNTRQIIDSYEDVRIRKFHNSEHLGLVKTWNKLLGLASGEYITWQDADDYSYPTRLEKLAKAMDDDPELMLCGSNFIRKFYFWNLEYISNFPLTAADISKSIGDKISPFLGATKIIRKEVVTEFRGFREFYDGLGREDHDLILRIAEKYKVANIPDVLYMYRYTRDSSSRKIEKNQYIKLIIKQIGFFLADQRKANNGIDSLMAGGDYSALEQFIESKVLELSNDPSSIYRNRSRNKINNKDYISAVQDAILAIRSNPKEITNYSLFNRMLGSLTKTIFFSMKRKFG